MKRILITGVTGFVGSCLVTYFHAKEGVKLYGHSRNTAQAKAHYHDFNIEIIAAYTVADIDALQIDYIIHLAGIAHDLSNTYVEADYNKVNYQDSARLYDSFLSSSASRFIYFSSIKAAVDHVDHPADEEMKPDPVTPYGKSKLKAEEYIQSQNLPADKSYYILRPCMIHGPNNKGNLNLLYRFVKSGIPYPLGAFENKRSFLGSDNLLFIIDQLIHQSIPSGVYHLADEGSLSTNEVVRIIANVLGKPSRIWRFPVSFVHVLFKLTGKSKMLGKLTENMEVSNQKILAVIHKPLPVSIEQGLTKTIQSFQ